ncbi:MAG: sugar-transfer associated ATP-grasp domain-containing protein [Solirubrobacterales bacterium]
MIEQIARKANLLKYSVLAARRFKQPLRPTLRRALTLYRERRFLAEEAFAAGLLRLDCDPELLRDLVSRRRQSQVQRRLNPESWAPVLADKGIFYRFCAAHGIPIPELYAIYFRKTPGYCPKGTPLYDSQQWARFIATSLPSEFVVKPCGSYRGTGVLGYEKKGDDEFSASDGVTRSSRQIVDFLGLSRDADSFVIQQRLHSCRTLRDLSANSNLQTLRLTTFIDREGRFRILFSHLKLMTRENVFTDNVRDGDTGTLVNVVCPENGTIVKAFFKMLDGSGDRSVSHHPVTHRKLIGLPVPCWDEACECVRHAAHAFLPIRSVGWDVGITDEGVRIIEGNIWWDRRHYAGDYLAILEDDLNHAGNARA